MTNHAVPLGLRERRELITEAFEPVRSILEGLDAYPAAKECGNLLIQAVDSFGECEARLLYADKAARLRGDGAEAVAQQQKRAMQANELGSLILQRATRALASDDSENAELDDDGRRELALLADHVRETLLDSPLKPKDADEVWRIWEEASNATSVHAVRDHVRGQLERLGELRRSDTRGTEDNIAWWKVAAIAAIVGVAVWGVICCLFRSCWCPSWAMALANVVLAVAAWVLWYC